MVEPIPTTETTTEQRPALMEATSTLRGALFCGLMGALIAFAPHVASRVWFGSWEFYQDFDEVLYRLVSMPALEGSWRMQDVFVQESRDLPTTYSWSQFVPTSHLATALGFDAVSLGQFWRLSGGFSMGIALYVVFATLRLPVARPRLFVILACLLALADAGFAQGRILIENLILGQHYATHDEAIKTQATAFVAYRVITPILNLPFSLLAAALLSPLLLHRKPLYAAAAAALTALTVTLYFFQWTALFAGAGSFLAMCLIYDAWKRTEYRRATMLALVALVVGMAIGSPQILSNARTFADPALQEVLERVGRGQKLPAGHPDLYANLPNRWFWLKFAAACLIATAFRHRGLALLTWIGFMGYMLANSAIVTRTEFENWHWLYVYNPFTAVVIDAGLVALAMRWLGPRTTAAGVAVFFVFGMALRCVEPALATESLRARRLADDIAPLRPIVAAVPFDGESCMAGELGSHVLALSKPGGRLLYHFPFSSQISLMSLDEVLDRSSLTFWLCGYSRQTLADMPDDQVIRVQPQQATRPEFEPAAVRAAILQRFDRLEASPEEARRLMSQFRPEWLLLEKSRHAIPPRRGGSWKRAATTELHELWTLADE